MVKKVVARIGLAANVGSLSVVGEIGYDTDVKVFRVGDGSLTPPRFMSDKSTGTFDFTAATWVRFKEIQMVAGGKIDGVDVSSLILGTGFISHAGAGVFANRVLTNTDGYITITNGSGAATNPTLNVSASFLALIPAAGVLYTVSHDATMSGNGTASSLLSVIQATNTQRGAIRIATSVETGDGILDTVAVTPLGLASLPAGSAVVNYLQSIIGVVIDNNGLGGVGTAVSPLTLDTATTTNLGGVTYATDAEALAGVLTTKVVSPFQLRSFGGVKATSAAVAPAGPKAGDIWYDTGVAGYKAYYNQSGVWGWYSVASAGAASGVQHTASSAPPAAPGAGDEWYDIDNDRLYKWVSDGVTTFWMQINGANVSGTGGGATGAFYADVSTTVLPATGGTYTTTAANPGLFIQCSSVPLTSGVGPVVRFNVNGVNVVNAPTGTTVGSVTAQGGTCQVAVELRVVNSKVYLMSKHVFYDAVSGYSTYPQVSDHFSTPRFIANAAGGIITINNCSGPLQISPMAAM
jgi:hypothetical protein